MMRLELLSALTKGDSIPLLPSDAETMRDPSLRDARLCCAQKLPKLFQASHPSLW